MSVSEIEDDNLKSVRDVEILACVQENHAFSLRKDGISGNTFNVFHEETKEVEGEPFLCATRLMKNINGLRIERILRVFHSKIVLEP